MIEPDGDFPPIDRLYYENPSIRLGGFLAFALKEYEGDSPRFNLIPGESSYARAQHQHFDALGELSEFLRESHAEPYYYRGQTKRRRVTYRGRVETLARAFPHLSPLSVTFESLIPSYFRSLLEGETANWKGYSYPSSIDMIAPTVRAIARSDHEGLRELLGQFLMDLRLLAVNNLLIRQGSDPRGGLPERIPMTNITTELATLVSLSQHYEFGSCMIDITNDPDVAIWFASHSWSGVPTVIDGQYGVVYRFNADAINAALQKELLAETSAQLAIFNAGLLGLVDISHHSDAFGLRPLRQAGGSIMGLENSMALYILDVYGALEVFTFPLATVSGNESSRSKDDLAPEDDPLVKVFDVEFQKNAGPLTDVELAKVATEIGLSADDGGILQRARIQCLI